MEALKLLSDDELIELYKGSKSIKKLILAELKDRGIEYVNKSFTKRMIKTPKSIVLFLRDCGFDCGHSKQDGKNPYASGICEFWKEIKGDDKYCFQINGEGLSEIKSVNEPVYFSINGKDPSITPMYKRCTLYPNFKSLIESENKLVDFSKGLMNFII